MARTAGKKALSQERILRAAVRYADRHGLDGLNMRKLAGLLDAGVMSLYHYFANKDELLDAMVEWVAGQIQIPDPGLPWRRAVRELSVSAYQTLRKHAWVGAIWSKRTLGPAKLKYMESILRILREGGFPVALACDAYHAITVHVHGYTLQAIDFPVKKKDMHSAAAGFLANIEDPESIPYFVEHVQHHLDHSGSGDTFGMMLDLMLDGFENALAAQ
ncbi:MAG: TetR/AcrR family transcriptional regulator [Pseudomonadota bacterium]